MASSRAFGSFKCLTFDCYGTLIDWETGIHRALEPLTGRIAHRQHFNFGRQSNIDRQSLLRAFTKHEGAVQAAEPTALYSDVLASAYERLAAELGVHLTHAEMEEEKRAFGASVGDWPVYPDTVDALTRLRKHFKMVILSNVDRSSFQQTLERQLSNFPFDGIYTAQDIGSYKPDVRNFQYLIARCEGDLGVRKHEILHVAQSLKHDHGPAREVGLESVWIERRGMGGEESVMGEVEEYEGRGLLTSWRNDRKFGLLGTLAGVIEAELVR